MNTNKYKFQITNFRTIFIGLFLFICTYLYLLDIEEVNAQTRIPLVVAPARQSIAIDPGKSDNLQIKFFNESASPISGNIKVVDFVVTGKDGSPILLEDQTNDWVKLPFDRATIPSGEVLKINFKVEVPKDTLAGGRYSAIMFEQVGQFSESSTKDESVSAVSSRIVGLLNIRINGEVKESAFVNIFRTPKFLEFGRIPVYFEILNQGGYHINPKGQLILTNWMGKEVERVTIEDKNIFPNAKRNYEILIGKKWMFGKYKVDLEANYGESGKTLLSSAFIWVIPVTIIIISIFLLLILMLSLYLISKKIKSRQEVLENKLEEEISELEALKLKFQDKLPK